MKTVWIVLGMVFAGMVAVGGLWFAGSPADTLAQDKSEDKPAEGEAEDENPPEVELPDVVPEATQGVVVSNPGAAVAVSRFYRLLQDADLTTMDVVATPFQLDGRKVLDDKNELTAFVEKAREGSLRKGRTATLMQMTFLPAGNTWEEAQRWLASTTTGERAKALFDHAEEHDAWLVQVLSAGSSGDGHYKEYALIAVTDADSEDKARVIGFMD